MSNESMLNSLLQGIQFKDPRLYDILREIIKNVQELNQEVFPQNPLIAEVEDLSTSIPFPVLWFGFSIFPTHILLQWTPPDTKEIYTYEIRQGTTWETANRILVNTGALSAVIDPLPTGTHTFLIKTINSYGNYSANAVSLVIGVEAIPAVSINAQVIDNTVLLYWNEPDHIFEISYYEVFRNTTSLGYVDATFKTIFEQVGGTYTYKIIAYDVYGNYSPPATITVDVSQPPDYVLEDERLSDFTGTRTNTTLIDGPALVCNTENQSYEAHFASRGWNSPQDQIDAGYPYYAQPTVDVGEYEEIVDYGTILTNLVVNVQYSKETLDGSGHDIDFELSVSDDGVTYDTPVVALSRFCESLRYLKVTAILTALD